VIHDEFSALPVSRQQRYQLRKRRDGLCIVCGAPATAFLCRQHQLAAYKRKKVLTRPQVLV
jgi:hypothetical protein